MSNTMNKDKMKAIAAELAKDIKTPDDLSQLSAMLTKLTVEAALKSEMNITLAMKKVSLLVVKVAIAAMVTPLKSSKVIMVK